MAAHDSKRTFCIVSSNHTGLVSAWEGDAHENKKFLGNRKVLAEVVAEDDETAMLKWRAIHQGIAPCAARP